MRDPRATALAHQCVERNRDTAGSRGARDTAALVEIMQVGLAIGDDQKGAWRMCVDFSRSNEAGAEQRRPDQLINRDERDEQHLYLAAPSRKLGGDGGGQSQGNAGLRDQSRPHVFTRPIRDVRRTKPEM
jgi:hypothetical protein